MKILVESMHGEEPYFNAFITNLGKYNEGELIGEWVEFPIDEDDFEEVLKKIGIGSTDDFGAPYEEWFATDYDTNLPGFDWQELGEYPSYETLQEYGELLESIDDLVDAQLEIRKPICYLKQTESCSFILLDEKEAYVYIEKLNEDVTSPIEIEIKEARLQEKSEENIDSEMLKDIEKTTIIKLSNKKSYKVSPVRKKKQERKIEQLEEIEVL